MVRYLVGEPLRAGRLGLLPAAFNPVTRAHLALADAAAEQADLAQVVFVLPAALPHKRFEGADFDDRLEMLTAAVRGLPERAAARCEGGLFWEIAEELGEACGPEVKASLVCGRDAAERIIGWDYGSGPSIAEQLERFELIVASRGGRYEPPVELRSRIRAIRLDAVYDAVSSSQVRRRIGRGEPWESLVPAAAADLLRRRGLYRGG